MKSQLAILIALVLCTGCWFQNYAFPEPDPTSNSRPESNSSSGNSGSDSEPTQGFVDDPLADLSFQPPTLHHTNLPGGLRVIARTLFDEAPGSSAYLQLTLPSLGTQHYGLPWLTAKAAVSSVRPGTTESLSIAIHRIGGTIDIDADHLTTSIRVTVPPERWHDALRRLTAAMTSVVIDRSTVEEIRRHQALAFRSLASTRPIPAVVDRLFDHRELGAEDRYAALQDLDASDAIAAYGKGYPSEGAVLSMVVPDHDADMQLRQARIILATWTGQEIAPPTRIQTPELPRRVIWAPTKEDRSSLILLLELPHTQGRVAAAQLIAIQVLTLDGIGGRLGQALAQIFPKEVAFHTEFVGRGWRRYLQLSANIANSQIMTVIAAFAKAAESLITEPPGAAELATAANRAFMRLVQAEQDPCEWLTTSTCSALKGDESDTSIGQTLAALERPTKLDLMAAFKMIAEIPPTWLVYGGHLPVIQDTLVILDDNKFLVETSLVREASETLQVVLATKMLNKAADAMGGQDRILAIKGYEATSRTDSTAGLRYDDHEWFHVTGRLRRMRKILATTIDTLIDGSLADETVGTESRSLEKAGAQQLLADAFQHPLLLIRSFLLGQDRYRLVATRAIKDRKMAILELIAPDRPRMRLHIDQISGLIRVVERIIESDEFGGGRSIARYRDYRNIAGLRIPFYRSTSNVAASTESHTRWHTFDLKAPEETAFKRDL